MAVQRNRNDAVAKMLEQLKHREIQVGFFETAHYPDGTPVAYVAAIQEFGYAAGKIPPRPFMRPAIAENKAEWSAQIAAGVRASIRGSIGLDAALGQVGFMAAGNVQNAIRAVTSPGLAESTIRNRRTRKNRNKNQSVKPLIDTATMIQAVTSKVETV